MPFADQMIAGVELMLLGMGIVFTFLILLVFVLKFMSFVALRLGTEAGGVARVTAPEAEEDTEIVAVITAAIKRYRKQHGK